MKKKIFLAFNILSFLILSFSGCSVNEGGKSTKLVNISLNVASADRTVYSPDYNDIENLPRFELYGELEDYFDDEFDQQFTKIDECFDTDADSTAYEKLLSYNKQIAGGKFWRLYLVGFSDQSLSHATGGVFTTFATLPAGLWNDNFPECGQYPEFPFISITEDTALNFKLKVPERKNTSYTGSFDFTLNFQTKGIKQVTYSVEGVDENGKYQIKCPETDWFYPSSSDTSLAYQLKKDNIPVGKSILKIRFYKDVSRQDLICVKNLQMVIEYGFTTKADSISLTNLNTPYSIKYTGMGSLWNFVSGFSPVTEFNSSTRVILPTASDFDVPGYEFEEWVTEDLTKITEIKPGQFQKDITLIPHFKANANSISYYDYSAGTAASKVFSGTGKCIKDGTQEDLPSTFATGRKTYIYEPVNLSSEASFDGWYKDSDCSQPVSKDSTGYYIEETVTDPEVKLYAKWKFKKLYLNQSFTGKNYSGYDKDHPVKSYEEVSNLRDGTDTIVYLLSGYTVSSDLNMIESEEITFKRSEEYKGDLITVENGAKLVLSHIILDGGAVWQTDKDPTSVNTGISASGSLLKIKTSGTASASSSTFRNNYNSECGGAIYCEGKFTSSNNYVQVTYNYSAKSGGGIFMNGDAKGAASYENSNTYLNLSSGTVEKNAARNHGGGIAVFGGYLYAGNSTLASKFNIRNNKSVSGSGGGIYVGSDPENSSDNSGTKRVSTIKSVEIYGNSAKTNGGGFFIDNGSCQYSDSSITSNKSDLYGGGIFTGSNAYVAVSNASVESNNAGSDGGGIYVKGLLALGYGSKIISNTVNVNTLCGGGVSVVDTGSASVEYYVFISGNKDNEGNERNLYLSNVSFSTLTVQNELYNNSFVSKIGITLPEDFYSSFTTGYPSYNSAFSPEIYFISDQGKVFGVDSEGEVCAKKIINPGVTIGGGFNLEQTVKFSLSKESFKSGKNETISVLVELDDSSGAQSADVMQNFQITSIMYQGIELKSKVSISDNVISIPANFPPGDYYIYVKGDCTQTYSACLVLKGVEY